MFQSKPSSTTTLTLNEVIHRLSQNAVVDGLIIIGSMHQDQLSPASDYDVVIVLSEMPVPLHVGVTYIDQRFTDLIFVTSKQVDDIINLAEAVDGNMWLGRLMRWLADGTIAFDRTGSLAQAQQTVQSQNWLIPLADNGYGPWFELNYNLAQTRRLLQSDDPLYLQTADIRMAVYGTMNIWFHYFTVRNLRWEGDKEAIRYLRKHDFTFLALFQQFIQARDRRTKFNLYQELVKRVLAPVGQLWPQNCTAFTIEGGQTGLEQVEAALGFWESLVAER